MISGDKVFLEGELFDKTTHKRLVKKIEAANPLLQMFFYQQMDENENLNGPDEKRRFLWLGHIVLEIIGATSPDNEDYVRVGEEFIQAAGSPQASFNRDHFKKYKPSFNEALAEAEYYADAYNKYLNECEETSFDSKKLWNIFYNSVIKAYALAMLRKMIMDGVCDGWKSNE